VREKRANGTGTLFKVTFSGKITVRHSFAANASDQNNVGVKQWQDY